MKFVPVDPGTLRASEPALLAGEYLENALPSYTNRNPVIRWLFRRRLEVALRLGRIAPGERVLDAGTGTGILLPSLVGSRCTVAAMDVELRPAKALIAMLDLPVEFVARDTFEDWANQNAGSFDCIFALDVLEHVTAAELSKMLNAFDLLMTKRGRLILSGPTETVPYRTARQLARYRGDYHHRTIFDIEQVAAERWTLEEAAWVPSRPLPRAFHLTRYVRAN